MGDRAWITSKEDGRRADAERMGMYLHWDGSPAWVKAIISYCDARGYRSVKEDGSYAWARMAQVACNLNTRLFKSDFDGSTHLVDGLSVGIDYGRPSEWRDCDNGVYLLDGWDIVGREDVDAVPKDDLFELMSLIDERFPEEVRLGQEKLREYVYDGKKMPRV